MMTASIESPLNWICGPAKEPGWAQLIRLGGDRVAVLFEELRRAVGKVDGIVERLHYLSGECRWAVQYCVGGIELFAVRISPGTLEVAMPLSRSDAEILLRTHNLSAGMKDAIRRNASGTGSNALRLPLTDRRLVRSFATAVKAKGKLVGTVPEPAGGRGR
jgi:hypothetical protein